MFNIFDKNKPFKDNDKWLTRYYWIGIISLFLGLAAGVGAGLVFLGALVASTAHHRSDNSYFLDSLHWPYGPCRLFG